MTIAPGRVHGLRLALVALIVAAAPYSNAAAQGDGCAAPEPVCAARDAVFAVSAFDPASSAVRIGPDLLVTNRHVVADERKAEIRLPDGRRFVATVRPSGYGGDLALLEAAGLPPGPVLEPVAEPPGPETPLHTVGLDTRSGEVRAYPPGRLLLPPAPGHSYARLYHSAYGRPGNSGGALVDAHGRLVGIVAAGGEGHNEAIPASALADLRDLAGPEQAEAAAEFGRATRECIESLEAADGRGASLGAALADTLLRVCPAAGNRQLLDLAAQALGRARRFADSRALFEQALARDPHAINSRLGLLVTLQLAGEHEAARNHAAWLLERLPAELEVERRALLAGVLGQDAELAKRAYALIRQHHPEQAPFAARMLERMAPDGWPPAGDGPGGPARGPRNSPADGPAEAPKEAPSP